MNRNFREVLATKGILSGGDLGEYLEAKAVIYFLMAGGDPRAELRHWADGLHDVLTFRPEHPRTMSVGAMRRKTVEAAQEEALKLLGIKEWSRSPFSNCWFPTDTLTLAYEEFGWEPSPKG
jgi:hypothetical protein